MTVDITPPIRSEIPDTEDNSLLESADSTELQGSEPVGRLPQEDAPFASGLDSGPRRFQEQSQLSHELLTMIQARERDLRLQLEGALREVESSHGELAYLRQCQQLQQRSQERLDEQLQTQLKELQQDLTRAHHELLERRGDVEALHQRNAELALLSEQTQAQAMERVGALELDLAAIRQQLSAEQAAAEAVRLRNMELEQRSEAIEQAELQARASAAGLEQALAAVRQESQEAHATADGLRQRHAALELELSTVRRDLSSRDHQVESLPLLVQERNALLERVGLLQEELAAFQGQDGEAALGRSLPFIREKRLKEDRDRLEEELESLHRLLEDLPEIFENKFRQRLQLVLDQQRRLLADNQMLREHLFALQPAPPSPEAAGAKVRLLMPAEGSDQDRPRFHRTLQRWLSGVLHRSRELSRKPAQAPASEPADTVRGADDLSDHDDGQPRAA
jgi:hypothetical protein